MPSRIHGSIPLVLGAGLAIAAPALAADPAPSAPSTTAADASQTWADAASLIAHVEAPGTIRNAEQLAALGAAAESAMREHPDEPRWKLAWVLIEAYSGRAKDVVDGAEEVAKALPADAHAQYALGLCLISSMDEVALWNKGARAERARDQWLKALELDPTYTSARISLLEYYRNAPAIAGGSTKKARELAQELTTYPSSAHLGHLFLAEMAGDEKKWDEFDTQITRATELAPTDAAREQITLSRALSLLNDKKDPAAALAVAQPVSDGGQCDYRFSFVCGRALRELDRCTEAVVYYQRVIAAMPTAENSRLDLALCLIEAGNRDEARTHLDRFLADHPKSERAKEAKKALKELEKSR